MVVFWEKYGPPMFALTHLLLYVGMFAYTYCLWECLNVYTYYCCGNVWIFIQLLLWECLLTPTAVGMWGRLHWIADGGNQWEGRPRRQLHKQPQWDEVQAEEQTIREADKQTSKRADKQTNRQADKHTSRQIDKQTSKRTDKQTSRQTDEETSRRGDTQINKQADEQTRHKQPHNSCRHKWHMTSLPARVGRESSSDISALLSLS